MPAKKLEAPSEEEEEEAAVVAAACEEVVGVKVDVGVVEVGVKVEVGASVGVSVGVSVVEGVNWEVGVSVVEGMNWEVELLEKNVDGSEPTFSAGAEDEAAAEEEDELLVAEREGRAWQRFVKERFRRSRFFAGSAIGVKFSVVGAAR